VPRLPWNLDLGSAMILNRKAIPSFLPPLASPHGMKNRAGCGRLTSQHVMRQKSRVQEPLPCDRSLFVFDVAVGRTSDSIVALIDGVSWRFIFPWPSLHELARRNTVRSVSNRACRVICLHRRLRHLKIVARNADQHRDPMVQPCNVTECPT